MMGNQKWFEAGSELADAHLEFLNFEKNFKPELEKKKAEFDALESKAEKLTAKLTAAKVDLDQKRVAIFAGLREASIKIRSDFRAVESTPATRRKSEPVQNIEIEIISKMKARASSGAETIHGQALACLRLERDLAATQAEKFQIAETSFQARRQAARKFFLSLIQVAGLSLKYQYESSGPGQADTYAGKVKELDHRLAIMQGEAEKFRPVKFTANSQDGVLEMASLLPAAAGPKLIQAWADAVLENAKKIMLTYTPDGILGWRITRPRPEISGMTSHDTQAYDIAGSSAGLPLSRHGRVRL